MQVTLTIDDRIYEMLKQGADLLGIDISDVLEHGADLAAHEVYGEVLRERALASSAWTVDPVTKAVTRAESHPLARPEDWDQAAARSFARPTQGPA